MAAENVEHDWSLSFIYPALVMGIVALFVFLFLPPEPRNVGLTLSTERTVRHFFNIVFLLFF